MFNFSFLTDWLRSKLTGKSYLVPADGVTLAGKQQVYRQQPAAGAPSAECRSVLAQSGGSRAGVVAVSCGAVARPSSVDMMQRLAGFLAVHYAFRYNVLTEQTEYARRETDVTDDEYVPLDDRALNGICLRAIRQGIDCWDRDVKRYLHSDLVPVFHPFTHYLDHLPAWDGTDRLVELAHRVSADAVWTRAFHRWMLAVVAQWRGLNPMQANSVAPLLVSRRQGWGKSTFARMLLPPPLQRYFTESFDLNSPAGAEQKLAVYGLINLDEYDRLPAGRQPLLKNLMQLSALRVRRAYKKQEVPLRRIASFIGTSNRTDLLTDRTGSRRFICVALDGPIVHHALDYNQLYAQLMHELDSGERYWFSPDEEAEIQQANRQFYALSPMEEVLDTCLQLCDEQEEGARLLSSADIYRLLKQANPAAMRATTCVQLARLLPEKGRRVHTRSGNGYWVKLRSGH